MAKTSMVNRDLKRMKLVKKFAARRAELKKLSAAYRLLTKTKSMLQPSFKTSA